MHRKKSVIPPIRQVEATVVVQPATTAPFAQSTIQEINSPMLNKKVRNQRITIICSGLVLMEVIPSTASVIIFFNVYFDCPASLSFTSK